MKPTIITIRELRSVNPSTDCFIIKNALPIDSCVRIVEFLNFFSANFAENVKSAGQNWRYFPKNNGNFFETYIFNELDLIDSAFLFEAFRRLFDLYNMLGEATFLNDFERETKISSFSTDFRIINPLVFRYPTEKSRFGFHKHDSRNQKFQLLTNLTMPGIDYVGGETWVYMQEGRPDIYDPKLSEKCVIFGEEFQMGDTLSFPYHYWHQVLTPKDAIYKGGKRISLLMPLGCRNSEDFPNEYL